VKSIHQLEGVRVRYLSPHVDKRGTFTELYRIDWKEFISENIVQVNLSVSKPGIIRAWHRHSRGQVDYMLVIKGIMRIMLKVRDKCYHLISSCASPMLVRIPGHYWHGTENLGHEDSMILYFVTKLYDYDNPDEEREEYKEPDEFIDLLKLMESG